MNDLLYQSSRLSKMLTGGSLYVYRDRIEYLEYGFNKTVIRSDQITSVKLPFFANRVEIETTGGKIIALKVFLLERKAAYEALSKIK
jgi:hypothetical protein